MLKIVGFNIFIKKELDHLGFKTILCLNFEKHSI